ncbi:prepilin-type N-terminal cleavage/methylation domain-containing protein [Hominenteromicrobium sp.]|uniref:prepilin-type N-terminal cleavage/methylation domain-containing protein n=1 Tax=Hominenteromicrobium sp. TaxID=3073581 RepID=UPI003AB5D09B
MNSDVYFHHVFVLFKDKAGILMKQNKNGFTLMEMLIVIAIIAVLIAVAIPVFASQLEKAREATDLANVRSAYAQVSTEALLGDSETTVTVNLKQKQADWQSVDPVNIGGIVHSKSQGDTANWIGVAEPNGTCVVSYKEDYGIILNWSGKADPSISKYPFDTTVTDFFPLLYNTEFWKKGNMKNNSNFEFDSGCPDSQYVPSIITEIKKLNNSLLQQDDCTWAYLGDGRDRHEADRYLFWTSLNTNEVGPGQKIPVIIQTGNGNYYVSETTTGKRNGKDYVTISKSLTTQSQYKEILNKGEQYSSLEKAYDAYLKALGDSKYDSVRQSKS